MSKAMKWIVAALALSLAVNVFVIGIAIGKRVSGPGVNHGGSPPGGGLNMRALGRYLSEEERLAARTLLENNRDSLRARSRQQRQNEQRIRALLMAETVDMQELEGLLRDHEEFVRDADLSIRRIVLEFVATLDVETRRAVAEDLFRRSRSRTHDGPPPRRKDRRGVDGPDRRPPPTGGF